MSKRLKGSWTHQCRSCLGPTRKGERRVCNDCHQEFCLDCFGQHQCNQEPERESKPVLLCQNCKKEPMVAKCVGCGQVLCKICGHEHLCPATRGINDSVVLAERAKMYPDAHAGHTNLGIQWTGILQQHYGLQLPYPVPAHVVMLMLAANKINRAVLPTSGKTDDFVDLRNYATLAEQSRRKDHADE